MRLFVLTNNPKRASFRQRIGIYLDILRTNGVDCEVVKLPSAESARLKLFKQAMDFEGVFLHKKTLNFFDAVWLRYYANNIIYDFDDAIMYSTEKPDSNRTSHFRLFRRTAKLADMIIAGNSYLAEHVRRFNPNVEVLPTGLDINAYKLKVEPKNDGQICLVWIGSKSTLRYLAEIKPALEEIGLRSDNVILRIICDSFFDLQNMKVEKRLWSEKTQAIDLATSDIGLAPLPDNRFTRGKCGFKTLQYAAARLPTVASPVGVNSEYILDGVTGYHATEIWQWVDKVSRLVGDIRLRKQMADAAGTQLEGFSSDVIGRKLTEMITESLKAASGSTKQVGIRGIRSITASNTGKPNVSVCIPTYNRKDYLRETLNSIFAQTYKDYEIIVVDDGSTDGTEDMIKELDFPVIYHRQENSGDAAARNKLLQLARGRYILFIDSDDLLLPDAIEGLVRVMEMETEDVVAYGPYLRIDHDSNVYGRCRRKLYSGNITKHLFDNICVHFGGSMFPRKILKEFPVFDTSLKVCSDYDFWLRISTKHRFVALSNPVFKRRRHMGNLSTTSFENCLTELEVLERFYEKDGENVIPKKIAMRRLGKEQYRVGKCAIKERNYQAACNLLWQSFRRHPRIKSAIQWFRAASMSRLQ